MLAVFALVDLSEELLLPLVSLVAGTVASTFFGTFVGWGVFVIAFYIVADRIYRGIVPDDVRGRGLAILFASCALAFGLALEAETPNALLTRVGITTCLSIVALTGYAHLVSSQSLFDPENVLIEPLAFVSRSDDDIAEEIKTDLSRTGALRVVGVILFVAATGIVLVFPAFLTGLTARFLMRAYPLPDLLAILWVGGTAVSRRTPAHVRRRFPAVDTRVDLEERLLGASRNATRSLMGLFATVFIALGALGAAGIFWVGFQLLASSGIADLVTATLVLSPFLWGVIGSVTSLLLAGVSSFWAWVRQYRRLPAFLDEWEGVHDPAKPPVDRMIGAVAVASVQMPLVAGFLTARNVLWVRIGFAIAWPLLITALCLSVFVSLRGHPRPVGRERLVIVGGVLSQLLSLLTASHVITHGRSVLENPLGIVFRPLSVMAVALVVSVSIIPDIDRFENEAGLNWVFPTYLLGMGVLIASSAVVWPSLGSYRIFLWVLTVVCILGGGALWIVRYFDL